MPKISHLEALRIIDKPAWERSIRSSMQGAHNNVAEAAKVHGLHRRAFERQLLRLERESGRLDRPTCGNPNFVRKNEVAVEVPVVTTETPTSSQVA